MRFYADYADWWPLLSKPEDYEEEARLYWEAITRHSSKEIKTGLELGSGGGNNALHLKNHCHFTLSDLSEGMVEVSKQLNPECDHVAGDMRSIRLEKTFDLVFIHDAIMFLKTTDDLLQVFQTAYEHLVAGGILFIAPDFFEETFKPSTDHGGHDDQQRSLRYLEWVSDRDPNDGLVETDYVYLLRENGGGVEVIHDQLVEGLFPKSTWEQLLRQAGFDNVCFETLDHSELEPGSYIGIVAKRS